MAKLGTEERPIILKLNSEQKIEKIGSICEKYDWKYISGLEVQEDLTDLKKALKEELEQDDPYSLCSCGSGKKYKFCCKKKMTNFDINQFINDFDV